MSGVTKETAEQLKDRYVEALREEARARGDRTRKEVGEVAVDVLEEYFPEAVRKRRRRDVASGFALGAIVGFLVRYASAER